MSTPTSAPSSAAFTAPAEPAPAEPATVAIASIEISRPRGRSMPAGAERAGGGSGMKPA